MLETYRKLYELLDARERKITLLVFITMLLVALFEAVGVASVMPFIAVVANPEVVETNRHLAAIYQWLGFESTDAFMFFLGVTFLVLIVGSIILRAFGFWIQVRFSQKRNYAWSCRLVEMYLKRPYEWFLGQHSGNLGSSVLSEVNRTVDGALFPAMQLISQAFVACLLIILMLAVDPILAMSVAAVLGGAYILTYLLVRRSLSHMGEEIQKTNRLRYKLSHEMFGGIKDVKVYGLEKPFLTSFRQPSLVFALRQIGVRTVSELPSFVMQALVFGGILIVLLYFLKDRGGLEAALPVVSLYALAGYRLMPALQSMYKQLSELRFNKPALDAVHQAFTEADIKDESLETTEASSLESAMGLKQSLLIEYVTYAYPGMERAALNKVTIEIAALSTVGLVGHTGSGKTTLVDVILGLLVPSKGSLVVDGVQIEDKNRRKWQKSIGYVPQQIFLSDDTVAANIAFGIPPDKIDHEAVVRASRVANLHDFVMQDLQNGYDTIVGERGVRLSGGQRQRIGIARALYRDPDILVLDEATSALDNLTELAVMEAVHRLSRQKTIILIAHRLSTVMSCDNIFYLERGEVIASGRYEELLENNSQFRRLAASADGQS